MNELNDYTQSEYPERQSDFKQQEADVESNLQKRPSKITTIIAMAASAILSWGCTRYLICEPCSSGRIQKLIRKQENEQRFKKSRFELSKGRLEIYEKFTDIYLMLLSKNPKDPELLRELESLEKKLKNLLFELESEKRPVLRNKNLPLIKKLKELIDKCEKISSH